MSLRTTLAHHLNKNVSRIRIILNAAVDCLTYYLAPTRQIDISKEGYETFLFLCHDLPPHFPRMVKWMQRNMKLHPVLVVVKRGEFSEFNIEYFEKIFTYRTIWQLRRLLSGLKGYDLMYTSGAVAWPMRAGIEKSLTPVVFDVKDTYIVNYGFHPPQLYMKLDLKNEKYAFMHADGIVSQSIEAYFAYQYYKIPTRPPTLFFPLYCDDDYLVEKPSRLGDDEIHLVYVGGFYGSSSSKAHFGNEIFFDIIDLFSAQQIHFHLYPAPKINKNVIQEYKAYAKKTPYLHVHDSVRQDVLAEEISQYQFGLVPFFNERTKRLNAKRERGTALKVFNYLEAGLPVIIANHCVFEKWMASRYGSAIGIEEKDLGRLRSMIESIDYPTLRRDLLKKRHHILLSRHIARHIHFCRKIMTTAKNASPLKSAL